MTSPIKNTGRVNEILVHELWPALKRACSYRRSRHHYQHSNIDGRLTTVNSQNYWIVGLCPLSGVLKIREYNIWETGCLHPKVWGKTRPLVGPLERVNLYHCLAPSKGANRVGVFLLTSGRKQIQFQ
jgi:hypothetical protein